MEQSKQKEEELQNNFEMVRIAMQEEIDTLNSTL